jgi:LysR family carnitine catabolism transcriptional activator
MQEPSLYHLKYFKTAAELGSIAGAAKKLGISQPAISQAIKKLEEILQCELLVHTQNRFKLTEEGKLLVARSGELLSFMDILKDDLKGLQLEPSGTLTIATSSSVAFYILPPLLQKLTEAYPKIRPSLQLGNAQEIIAKVKTGECEIGLLIDDGGLSGLERKLIQKGSFRCIAADGTSASANPRFMVTKESPGLYELERAYKKHSGKNAEIAMEIESWDVIAQMAQLGMGVGFVPDFIANNHPGVKTLNAMTAWSQKIDYRLFLLHQGTHQLSAVAQLLVKEI